MASNPLSAKDSKQLASLLRKFRRGNVQKRTTRRQVIDSCNDYSGDDEQNLVQCTTTTAAADQKPGQPMCIDNKNFAYGGQFAHENWTPLHVPRTNTSGTTVMDRCVPKELTVQPRTTPATDSEKASRLLVELAKIEPQLKQTHDLMAYFMPPNKNDRALNVADKRVVASMDITNPAIPNGMKVDGEVVYNVADDTPVYTYDYNIQPDDKLVATTVEGKTLFKLDNNEPTWTCASARTLAQCDARTRTEDASKCYWTGLGDVLVMDNNWNVYFTAIKGGKTATAEVHVPTFFDTGVEGYLTSLFETYDTIHGKDKAAFTTWLRDKEVYNPQTNKRYGIGGNGILWKGTGAGKCTDATPQDVFRRMTPDDLLYQGQSVTETYDTDKKVWNATYARDTKPGHQAVPSVLDAAGKQRYMHVGKKPTQKELPFDDTELGTYARAEMDSDNSKTVTGTALRGFLLAMKPYFSSKMPLAMYEKNAYDYVKQEMFNYIDSRNLWDFVSKTTGFTQKYVAEMKTIIGKEDGPTVAGNNIRFYVLGAGDGLEPIAGGGLQDATNQQLAEPRSPHRMSSFTSDGAGNNLKTFDDKPNPDWNITLNAEGQLQNASELTIYKNEKDIASDNNSISTEDPRYTVNLEHMFHTHWLSQQGVKNGLLRYMDTNDMSRTVQYLQAAEVLQEQFRQKRLTSGTNTDMKRSMLHEPHDDVRPKRNGPNYVNNRDIDTDLKAITDKRTFLTIHGGAPGGLLTGGVSPIEYGKAAIDEFARFLVLSRHKNETGHVQYDGADYERALTTFADKLRAVMLRLLVNKDEYTASRRKVIAFLAGQTHKIEVLAMVGSIMEIDDLSDRPDASRFVELMKKEHAPLKNYLKHHPQNDGVKEEVAQRGKHYEREWANAWNNNFENV